jgi:hypothetical protein
MPGYAKQIALDVIAQLAALNEAAPLAVPDYEAAFQRMYVTDLESLVPAGDPASKMQIVLAPVETVYERTGWGGVRITVTLGLLFNIAVATAAGEVTDERIDAYEQLVDEVCTFLVGPRLFAGSWSAKDPLPIFGDHYNDHLYEKSEFHVPVLVDFFQDVGVS